MAMKSAKEALENLVKMIGPGKKPEWERKTQFIAQEDGTCIRRIIRRDGSIELEYLPAKLKDMLTR